MRQDPSGNSALPPPIAIYLTVNGRDLQLEVNGIADLREGIATAQRTGDAVSRELMVGILTDEEHHEDHLITQLELIEKIGLENYIAAHL